MSDVIAEMGSLFLGSRLKRLAEQFQASATKILQVGGLKILPAHQSILLALEKNPLTVGTLAQAVGSSQPNVTRAIGQLVELGLVNSERSDDLRERHLSLTSQGRSVLNEVRQSIWPAVQISVDELCKGLSGTLLEQIGELEARLKTKSFDARVAMTKKPKLTILEYDDRYASRFADLNKEWITSMFSLEAADEAVLNDPRNYIIEKGGTILFVEAEGHGIIGTGALRRDTNNSFELTKMAVSPAVQGLGVGRWLVKTLIDRAHEQGASEVWLLSNTKCAAAVHLYESLGFIHDKHVMETRGAVYKRANVAMSHSSFHKI